MAWNDPELEHVRAHLGQTPARIVHVHLCHVGKFKVLVTWPLRFATITRAILNPHLRQAIFLSARSSGGITHSLRSPPDSDVGEFRSLTAFAGCISYGCDALGPGTLRGVSTRPRGLVHARTLAQSRYPEDERLIGGHQPENGKQSPCDGDLSVAIDPTHTSPHIQSNCGSWILLFCECHRSS